MTLIEVLVVIFVIALLAILLSALAESDRKALRINCVNNLKTIAISSRVCAGDNDGKYPMQFAVTNNDMMKLIGSGNAYVWWQTMSNELYNSKYLLCPADTEHIAAKYFPAGFSDANISYFFGLDVRGDNPQAFLAGDDNFAINGKPVQSGILNLATNVPVTWTSARHKLTGNIALTDSSVQQTTSAGLNTAIANGITTNSSMVRLVIP